MTDIQIYIDGVPVGKGRPRVFRTRNGIGARTPKKTSDYETRIADAAKLVWTAPPLTYPIRLSFVAVFPPQAQMRGLDRQLANSGDLWHVAKPDLDNVAKCVGDALNGIIWTDDSQICEMHQRKQYGAAPGLWITIEPLGQN